MNERCGARPVVVGKIAKALSVTPEFLTEERGEFHAE